MKLCATLTKEELVRAALELTPLDIAIAERPKRSISLGRPSTVELIAGAGLRLGGSARATWDVAGVSIPVTVRRWQVLFRVSIAEHGADHVLAFVPVVEALDVERVPGFVDERLARALGAALTAKRDRLVWNFTRTLSYRRLLPARLSPTSRFELVPGASRIDVTASSMSLTVELRARVAREAAPQPAATSPARA
jgi:hypothetical protein